MERLCKVFFSGCFLISLSGCIKTRGDVKEMEQKRVVQDQVTNLQRSTADQTSKVSELTHEIRELHGRLEVIEKNQRQLADHLKEKAQGEGQRSADVDRKFAVMQEEIGRIEALTASLTQEIQAAKAAPPAEASKSTIDSAEEFFNRKEYKKAILAYQRYRDQNPKSKRNVAKATFKIGLSFHELGLKDDAKPFFTEVIEKFPQSEEAKLAKLKLSGDEGRKAKKKRDKP